MRASLICGKVLITAAGFLTLASTASAQLIISEFRLRGPSGANDEFIELYNNSGADHTVAGGGTGYAVAASDGVARCVVPNGTVIPNHGHYLCVNSVAYSLASYPAGNNSTATGDSTYTLDIPDNAGIAIFNTSVAVDFTLANRLDAVGSTSEANPLYKEGTGYSALTPFSIDYAFHRDECGKGGSIKGMGPCTISTPKDTNNNAADFIYVDTNGTSAGAGQRLGAPGPQNLSSPISGGGLSVALTPLDTCVAQLAAPNYVRDFTSDPAQNSTFGTSDVRLTFTNNTGSNLTRLRFRVVDLTTFPAPSGFADYRPRTSSSVVVNVDRAPCGSGTTNITVQGTTLEQAPSQPNGGGFNSTMSVGTVTQATPLANGASVDLRLLLGIQQIGVARLGIIPEGLSGGGAVLGNVLSLSGSTDGGLTSLVPTSVTVNQANGQVDPTGASQINFTAVFDQAVTGFTGTDVSFAGSTASGNLTANVTGGPTTFNIAVTGMTGNGTVVASIPSNVVDQTNPASTSADNSVTFQINSAPIFVGATTTLNVLQDASATDIKSLLHASYPDSADPLTWSQSAAPSHGTLSFSSATASGGSADITPGGVITYTPTAGYAGADSFVVQVSDGVSTHTRTINVTVVPVVVQPGIATTAAGVTASLSVAGCSAIVSPAFMPASAGGPAGFPYGLLGFTLTGCTTGGTATVTVTYSENLPSGATFYKYQNGSYATYPATVGANTVTFTLTDGGAGDSDGARNGSIRDPGGIGVPMVASLANIPTLSEWGMFMLSLLLVLGASFTVSSSKRAKPVQPPR